MNKRLKILCIIFFFSVNACSAQVLNGTWHGNYAKMLLSGNPESLIIEITMINDSLFTGASHLYYKNNKYEHHKISGKINLRDSTALFAESYISSNLAMGVMEVKYKMKLLSQGDHWRMEGLWKGVNSPFGFMGHQTVWLEKPKDNQPIRKNDSTGIVKNDSISHKPVVSKKDSIPVAKKDSIAAPAPVEQKWKRAEDIQRIIEIEKAEKDSIQIAIYDNGEVDGDSISVLMDNALLLNKSLITAKPIILFISLNRSAVFHKLSLVAENLGTIPPNTALMIVTTKTKRYEVRLSSDLQKNATVEFVLLQ